jgi:tRNA-binding EMAP/Myf-like protein
VERTAVESSHIASIGYDPETKVMQVEFRTGKVFDYIDVPAETHANVMQAESKGRAFKRVLAGGFEFRRVPQE